jgi:alanyl-tRNA synthetase
MTRSATDVGTEFLEFFRQRGHEIVPGSPVVPYDDPALPFTNGGGDRLADVLLPTRTRGCGLRADTHLPI